MNNVFYTAVEIAQILKISKSLAYRLIAQGEIPAIRFGRTVRVRQEDLEQFVEKYLVNGINKNIFDVMHTGS